MRLSVDSGYRFWRAFFLSLLMHAVLAGVLLWAIQDRAEHGLSSEPARQVGIALKFQDGQREYFVDETSQQGESSFGESASNSAQQPGLSLRDVVPSPDTLDFSRLLPGPGFQVTPSPGVSDSSGTVGGEGDLLAGGGFGRSPGPVGSASLFGIQSPGNKFVYVFDRSGSMGGVGRTPLAYAKRELISSLQSLDKTQQFQIIFYNDRPTLFHPSGQPGRLSFATEENKARAIRFIQSITADGGTQHDAALLMAIQLRPDVIFFLTDADEPRLSDARLEQIHQRANGIVIHAIEFGIGPRVGSENFLSRLARQNGGQYVYIDITQVLR